jgi:phage FluMu protein Com
MMKIKNMRCPHCNLGLLTDGKAVWCERCKKTWYWDQPLEASWVKRYKNVLRIKG